MDLNEIIIPFFQKYNIFGVKHFDFLDFCKVGAGPPAPSPGGARP